MESLLVKDAKTMDWFARLVAGKRPNLSNCLGGEHGLESLLCLRSLTKSTVTPRFLNTPSMRSLPPYKSYIP